ncbi:MAG: hypothetical protein ACFFA0_15585, partial [Promethearchaeota archaeon]
DDDVPINIAVESEFTSDPQIDLSIYLKNQILELPITTIDYDALEVTITNGSYTKIIELNLTYTSSGIYFNDTFNLPSPSYKPYSVIVNLTIGPTTYSKTTKILYYDSSKVPIINSLTSSESTISRATSEYSYLNAQLDKSGNIDGFLTIYSFLFENSKKSVNKSLTFNNIGGNNYRHTFDPETNDPSGYAIFYIEPSNENYTNPKSPRITFQIENNPPEIIETTSSFQIGGGREFLFDDVVTPDGVLVVPAKQGDTFNFMIDLTDTVSFEDDNSNMRIFITLIMVSTTDDGYIVFIFPASFVVNEILHEPLSDRHQGYFTIPSSMNYDSIAGTKSVSTAADFDFNTSEGYLGVLYITAYDSEGGFDDFILLLKIDKKPIDISIYIIIVIGVIALIGIVSMSIYFIRRKKITRTNRFEPRYQDYYYQPSYDRQEDQYITPEPATQISPSMYCPFCGGAIVTPKKFCPYCGKSITFTQQGD